MKKNYETPEVKLIESEANDIIMSSISPYNASNTTGDGQVFDFNNL